MVWEGVFKKTLQLRFSLKNLRRPCGTLLRVRLQSSWLKHTHGDGLTLFIFVVARDPQFLWGESSVSLVIGCLHVCVYMGTHTRTQRS